MTLSMNVVILLYLVASVFFIQALKGLSHPTTSRRGNAFGMIGMAIAIVTTVALIYKTAPQLATAATPMNLPSPVSVSAAASIAPTITIAEMALVTLIKGVCRAGVTFHTTW